MQTFSGYLYFLYFLVFFLAKLTLDQGNEKSQHCAVEAGHMVPSTQPKRLNWVWFRRRQSLLGKRDAFLLARSNPWMGNSENFDSEPYWMMITSGPNGDYGQISIIDGKDDGKLPPDSSLSASLDPIQPADVSGLAIFEKFLKRTVGKTTLATMWIAGIVREYGFQLEGSMNPRVECDWRAWRGMKSFRTSQNPTLRMLRAYPPIDLSWFPQFGL